MVILYYHICVYAMLSVTFFREPRQRETDGCEDFGTAVFLHGLLPIGDAASFRPAANKKTWVIPGFCLGFRRLELVFVRFVNPFPIHHWHVFVKANGIEWVAVIRGFAPLG